MGKNTTLLLQDLILRRNFNLILKEISHHFQCLKSSAGSPLAVEKGPGPIAPLQAELWPFKEGNCQICLKIDAKVTYFGNPFSNGHISGLEWSFAKIQKPQIISLALASPRERTQVNCTSGGWAMPIQRGQPSVEFLQILWKLLICVQTHVSQAWPRKPKQGFSNCSYLGMLPTH